MEDLLYTAYPWIKTVHIVAVISWMAGLLYLPRLYVNHAQFAPVGSDTSEVFKGMEERLLRIIMNPAMIVAWIAGIIMASTPGLIDWSSVYPYVKAAMVIGMTWFHHWLAKRRKEFARDENTRSAKQYRMVNEVPAVMMIVIVTMIIVRPF
ncbi:MAG: protoporphyrinogen oxidase HemJ [Pseudomonadota bacterium]